MKKFIFAAVATLFYSHAYSQVADDAPVNKQSHHHRVVIQQRQQISQPIERPAPLPALSKESTGFCQASNYAQNPNYDMMDLYLQQGADVNAYCDSYSRVTALFQSLSNNGNPNYPLADWLIQHGADINIASNFGGNQGVTVPMVVATGDSYRNVNQKALNYLIQHGANFRSVDGQGRTALHWFKSWDFIGFPTNTGFPNLSSQTIAFMDQLISQGIDINIQDKSGATVLMNAVVNAYGTTCSPESIKLLLSHGANTALKNKLGKSALDLAMERAAQAGQNIPCNEVVKILYNPQQISKTISGKPGYTNNSVSTNGISSYVGTYGGEYTGLDYGVFQADIYEDGTATFHLHSNKSGGTVTHAGSVNSDGSISFGKPGIGAVFAGNINRDGVLAGTWQAPDKDNGSFQGKKGVKVVIPDTNVIQVFGSLFK